jgi:hypothetical protein
VEDRANLVERKALERVSRVEVENAASLASACEDAEGFVRNTTLHEGEVERRAQEVSEREHREQYGELTLLQTQGYELCHSIISPPWAGLHMSEGM